MEHELHLAEEGAKTKEMMHADELAGLQQEVQSAQQELQESREETQALKEQVQLLQDDNDFMEKTMKE